MAYECAACGKSEQTVPLDNKGNALCGAVVIDGGKTLLYVNSLCMQEYAAQKHGEFPVPVAIDSSQPVQPVQRPIEKPTLDKRVFLLG